jgi:serine protease Do
MRFAGQSLAGPQSLQALVERCPLDSRQKLQVLRDGKPLSVEIVMKSLPDDFAAARVRRPPAEIPQVEGVAVGRLGFEVAELTTQLADRLNYSNLKGVLVSKVDENSLAYDRGLRVGMLITKIGKRSIGTVDEFQAAMKEESLKEGLLLSVRFGNSNRFIVLDER